MPNPQKTRKVKPSVIIERIMRDGDTGHITAVDLHDEETGYAVFCERKAGHFHGFYSPKPKKK